jgi:hypothetical protein
MSLEIDPEDVLDVLLADGWHEVLERSFTLDAYEFVESGGFVLHSGGNSGVCSTGFMFKTSSPEFPGSDAAVIISGPLTAILAVKTGL